MRSRKIINSHQLLIEPSCFSLSLVLLSLWNQYLGLISQWSCLHPEAEKACIPSVIFTAGLSLAVMVAGRVGSGRVGQLQPKYFNFLWLWFYWKITDAHVRGVKPEQSIAFHIDLSWEVTDGTCITVTICIPIRHHKINHWFCIWALTVESRSAPSSPEGQPRIIFYFWWSISQAWSKLLYLGGIRSFARRIS